MKRPVLTATLVVMLVVQAVAAPRQALAAAPTLTSAETNIAADRYLAVSWSGIPSPTGGDWISLFAVGTPDNGPRVTWAYTGGGASGTLSFAILPNVGPGDFEFRLFANNGLVLLARSAPISVHRPQLAVTTSFVSFSADREITVSWSGPHAFPSSGDWISLFPLGAPSNGARTAWRYTTGAAAGSVSFGIAPDVPPGSYEFRMFWSNGLIELGRSAPVIIGAPAVSLVWVPAAPAPGDVAQITWSGHHYADAGDWIGLYLVGTSDQTSQRIAWMYTGGGRSGSIAFGVPASLPTNRSYEFRMFWANGLQRLDGIGMTPTPSNRAPVVNAGPNGGTFVRQPFARIGTFADPDVGQSWLGTVDFGDGAGSQALPLGPGTFELSHTYERPGVYAVLVAVTDTEGGYGQARFDIEVSPARSFIFVHGLTGSYRDERSFLQLIRPLEEEYPGIGRVYRFQYWQDVGDRLDDTTRECGPLARTDFDPLTPSFGLPLTTTSRSLTLSVCDSQSDVGINAILLDREVRRLHERFAGNVTIIANSMGGAIARAYLAYAQASKSPTLGYLDLVVFLQAAHQGSYATLARPVLAATTGLAGLLVVPLMSEAVRMNFAYDPSSPSFEDLTPMSPTYGWVNEDPAHVPSDVAFLNVASEIDLTLEVDLFGHRLVLDRMSLGDYLLLPGSDDPRATPLFGGARFDPRVIGRGAPGTEQVILRRDVAIGIDRLRPLEQGGMPALLESLSFPEWHGAFGERMGEITVPGDGRTLDRYILDRIREAGR